MNSQQIQEHIFAWADSNIFDAPYGVLTGKHTNNKGKSYLSVTFGKARTLDATVEIYNRNFIVLRTSRTGTQAFRSVQDLQLVLDSLK